MRTLPLYLLALLLIGGLASCSNSVVDPAGNSENIFQGNVADIKTYATTKGLSGTTTTSGLFYSLTRATSSSVSPANGQEIEFNYRLYALLGPSNVANAVTVTDVLLDSTYLSKSAYRQFYSGGVLPGLEEGLLKMHEGEQATLLMPSILAFGDGSTSLLPANSPVRFDIRLIRVRTEDQQINEYMTANKLTPTEVTNTGLRFIKTQENSSGSVPSSTQTLTIRYKGQLLRSASAFDSTGTGTYSATLGQFVPGFDEGLAKLRIGEKATIIFPSKLGYSTAGVVQNGNYVIPPYAPLRFDIELVSAK
ncbi:hypothetical protein GCM10028805_10190 [Spirosoma harenae]